MPPKPSGVPNSLILRAIDRQRQPALGARKGDGGRQPARIAQRGEIRTPFGRFFLPGDPRRQARVELGDQVLEIVGLAGELAGAGAFLRERLLAVGLLLLALIGQQAQALALQAQAQELA